MGQSKIVESFYICSNAPTLVQISIFKDDSPFNWIIYLRNAFPHFTSELISEGKLDNVHLTSISPTWL